MSIELEAGLCAFPSDGDSFDKKTILSWVPVPGLLQKEIKDDDHQAVGV